MRKWPVSRRLAACIWGVLAVFLTADFCGNLRGKGAVGPTTVMGAPAWLGRTSPAGTVALTFDDGPHAVYTPKLLDGLKERGVHASFFLVGQNIDGNEDILLRMQTEGHLIGNHSQNHMQLTAGTLQTARGQIDAANRKIRQIIGYSPAYIRPPYGSWSEELGAAVSMTVVLWNLDPLDWKLQDEEAIVRYVEKHVENGSIILLHDVYETSVDAALRIVDDLKREGYEFVTVDELLIE